MTLKSNLLLSFLCLLFLDPCFAQDVSDSTKQAELVIYRPRQQVGSVLKVKVWINDECYKLKNKEILIFEQPLGNYLVATKSSKFELELKSGSTYYFRLGFEFSLFKNNPVLIQVTEEQAKKDIALLTKSTTDQ